MENLLFLGVPILNHITVISNSLSARYCSYAPAALPVFDLDIRFISHIVIEPEVLTKNT